MLLRDYTPCLRIILTAQSSTLLTGLTFRHPLKADPRSSIFLTLKSLIPGLRIRQE